MSSGTVYLQHLAAWTLMTVAWCLYHPHPIVIDLAKRLPTKRDPSQQTAVVYFDDHQCYLKKGEDVRHWLPIFDASAERHVAKPRIILPEGKLGSRVSVENPPHMELPHWQAARVTGQPVQKVDPISKAKLNYLRIEKVEILPVAE